jgi:arylsulfatase A-like enzyme
MRDEKIIERPTDQHTLTKRYTEAAVRFINRSAEGPFLLYLAHTMPHVPLFRSKSFAGKSARGVFGDVVEEIDWSVGTVLDALSKRNLHGKTFVFFTSDNGPWLTYNEQGGSAGLLRGGKGSTWEGGMREPAIAWWPGRVAAGTVTTELATTMDLFTTCLSLAGAAIPEDRVIDGVNLTPVLFGTGGSRRDTVLYYRGTRLMAVRKGPWKAHFATQNGFGGEREEHPVPLLYRLDHDPSEKYELSKKHPDVIAELEKVVATHQETLAPVESDLEKLIGQ